MPSSNHALMASISIVLPIYWAQTKSKTVLVSMNAYRNWHYHTSNKFKKEFTELVTSQLDSCTIPSPFKVDIKIHYKNSACDGSNVASLIEKVLLDALQEGKVITQDSVKHHTGTTWTIAGQDKTNPRCEITIYSTEEHT